MKLYKYRSFSNMEFVLDILLNQRLHCSRYDKLNDPFEGIFLNVIRASELLSRKILPPKISQNMIFPPFYNREFLYLPRSISQLPIVKKTRICSLSSCLKDIRLWSNYADGHRGVAIEIDFTGMEDQVHKVKYIKQLKKFGDTILTSPESTEVLRLKTEHWHYEEEYRHIGDTEYISIEGRIRAIYCGLRISDLHKEMLIKVVDKSIPIFSSQLNEALLTVETGIKLTRA